MNLIDTEVKKSKVASFILCAVVQSMENNTDIPKLKYLIHVHLPGLP